MTEQAEVVSMQRLVVGDREVLVGERADGPWVSLRDCCDAFGCDLGYWAEKLAKTPGARVVPFDTMVSGDRKRKRFLIDLPTACQWLTERRTVAPEADRHRYDAWLGQLAGLSGAAASCDPCENDPILLLAEGIRQTRLAQLDLERRVARVENMVGEETARAAAREDEIDAKAEEALKAAQRPEVEDQFREVKALDPVYKNHSTVGVFCASKSLNPVNSRGVKTTNQAASTRINSWIRANHSNDPTAVIPWKVNVDGVMRSMNTYRDSLLEEYVQTHPDEFKAKRILKRDQPALVGAGV